MARSFGVPLPTFYLHAPVFVTQSHDPLSGM